MPSNRANGDFDGVALVGCAVWGILAILATVGFISVLEAFLK